MNKALGLLGLVRKSGKLTLGFDATKQALIKRKVFLLLIANDCSTNTKDSIVSYACDIPTVVNFSSFELSKAIGSKRVVLIGITDEGLAQALFEKIKIGGIE